MTRRILLASLAFIILAVVHRGWTHWPSRFDHGHHKAALASSHAEGEEVMIDERFSVSPGGSLDVQVGDADILVETGNVSEAHVQVVLEGRDMDRARRYFEAQRFTVLQTGNSIRIATDEDQNWRSTWNDTGDAHIRVHVRIPSVFDASLATSDGNVSLGDLRGRVAIRTSDGDITTSNLNGNAIALKTSDGNITTGIIEGEQIGLATSDGDVHVKTATGSDIALRTSDGNITAERLRGRIAVATSDGDIRMGQLDGPVVNLKTSDGEIVAEAISAEEADVVTSDGNIRLPRMDGALRASTSSGQIDVYLLKPAQVQLRTTDGDIHVTAPQSIPANIRLKGGGVKMASSFMFKGRVQPDEVDGMINGGGPLVEAYASDGTVIWGQED